MYELRAYMDLGLMYKAKTKKDIFNRLNNKMINGRWNIRFKTKKDLENYGFYITKQQ